MTSLHELIAQAKHWIDGVAGLLAGVAIFALLQQIAVAVTILAGFGSLSLVALRWHDRLKYGHTGKGD